MCITHIIGKSHIDFNVCRCRCRCHCRLNRSFCTGNATAATLQLHSPLSVLPRCYSAAFRNPLGCCFVGGQHATPHHIRHPPKRREPQMLTENMAHNFKAMCGRATPPAQPQMYRRAEAFRCSISVGQAGAPRVYVCLPHIGHH